MAVLAGNSGAFVRAVHAIARLGATLLPLNIRLTPAELAWQVRDAGARLVLADEDRMPIAKGLGVTAFGVNASNYDIRYDPGTLTVVAAP